MLSFAVQGIEYAIEAFRVRILVGAVIIGVGEGSIIEKQIYGLPASMLDRIAAIWFDVALRSL